jgi:hypothetical protein
LNEKHSKQYEIVVAGGGISGVCAAISAARQGCSVLIVERNGCLGGCATAGLVTPMMKNIDSMNMPLNPGLFDEITGRLTETGDCAAHSNGNAGWFNPEKMKILLDEMCEENNVDVLFETQVVGAKTDANLVVSTNCINKAGLKQYPAQFFIDATGDADLAHYAGVRFEADEHQSLTLRFIIDNVDICRFGEWLIELEPDMTLSSLEYTEQNQVLLTTACTSEEIGWKLKPYFQLGIRDGVIKPEDAEYFQLFSIPGQSSAVALNCPRIYADRPLNPLDPWDISYAYVQGRKQIKRLEAFCKAYLTGFEDAYVSQIAQNLGVRDSRRINGVYKLTEDDVLGGKKFENPAAKSNYPVDIHGDTKRKSQLVALEEGNYYEIPVESLMCNEFSNLLVVGKCLSATFAAQASARIMPNCIAMGETAGRIAGERVKGQRLYS